MPQAIGETVFDVFYLGFAAGLKLDCPVRNPGGHDEIRFAPPFQTVGFRVYSRPLANIINRKKLSSVSMP